MSPRNTLLIAAASAVLGACGTSHSTTSHAPPGDVPAKAAVAGGQVTMGVALLSFSAQANADAFSISKTPTTVGQYRQCVAAGACQAPSLRLGDCSKSLGNFGATYSSDKSADNRPVTCVSSDQAAQYCSWVGGRLPNMTEWVLAARGPAVQRFAWGNTPANCSQRPNVRLRAPFDCCGSKCDSEVATAVGMHPAGDSPLGLSDVLLTPSEIVGATPDATEAACRTPSHACLVTGIGPGAIDMFVPEATPDDPSMLSPSFAVASFRCAWAGGSQ